MLPPSSFQNYFDVGPEVYLLKKLLGKKLMSWSRNKNQKAKIFIFWHKGRFQNKK